MSCGTYSKGQQVSSRQGGTCQSGRGLELCWPSSWFQAHEGPATVMMQLHLMANSMQLGSPVPARLVGAVWAATEAGLQHTKPFSLVAAVV